MSAVTDIQRQFKNGRLPLAPGEFQKTAAKFGRPRVVPQNRTIGAKVALAAGHDNPMGLKVPASELVDVGEAPEGFGKYVTWAEEDRELAVVIFLNAGDPSGVGILGVRPSDTIEFVSATGLASFAEETENEGVAALIGVVAAGLELGATVFGVPQAGPLIAAGAEYAKDRFKENKVRTKIRDPYGEEPSTHVKARQEGGVIVCAPEAGGILCSGTDEKWWIKKPGDRTDGNRPPHVAERESFFLQRRTGERRFNSSGDVYVLAWDHVFTDNFGFYELHVILRRGGGVDSGPVSSNQPIATATSHTGPKPTGPITNAPKGGSDIRDHRKRP